MNPAHHPPRPHRHVLQLDQNGVPQDWISLETAACHHATDSVAWFDGAGPLAVMRGGHNAKTGRQSLIEVYPIIAMRGQSRINLFDVDRGLTKAKVIARDRSTCAFCGCVYPEHKLTLDHIIPASRGGQSTWMNLISACLFCNSVRKRNRTPEEAGMPLLFLPYVPSRWEAMLLEGRNIRADVHEWLAARLPKTSRLI